MKKFGFLIPVAAAAAVLSGQASAKPADSATADAALRNLEAAFIGLYYLVLVVPTARNRTSRSVLDTVIAGFSLHARLLVNLHLLTGQA